MPQSELYKTIFRQVPSVQYAFENILTSLTMLLTAWCSLCLTLFLLLPLSFVKKVFGPARQEVSGQSKSVLVVGLSRGLGFDLLQQYMNEKDTVIVIATTISDLEDSRKMVIELGTAEALFHVEEISLGGSRRQIGDMLKQLESQYGPFSQFVDLNGLAIQHKKHGGSSHHTIHDGIISTTTNTVTLVLSMYDLMQPRGGNICVVSPIAGAHYTPTDMVLFYSVRILMDNLATYLRLLGSHSSVDVVSVQLVHPIRISNKKRTRDAPPDDSERMAKKIKEAIEQGGIAVVSPSFYEGAATHAVKVGLNPICEDILRRFKGRKMIKK